MSFDASTATGILRLLLLLILSRFIYLSAKKRAPYEARKIAESDKELGYWWHVQMWISGKSAAGVFCVVLYTAACWNYYAAFAMAGYSMALYWWYFDSMLSMERGYDRWYISLSKATAQTDKLLREVMWRMKWTPEQTHKRVKLPLMFLGFVGCVIVAFV